MAHPEARVSKNYYMRLDIVFEGALEEQYDFTEDEVWEEWRHELQMLETHYPNKDWTISVYDTRPYPPELVKEHRNGEYEE